MQPSVYESCRFLSMSFKSFITPTLIYRSCLELSFYRFIIKGVITGRVVDLPSVTESHGYYRLFATVPTSYTRVQCVNVSFVGKILISVMTLGSGVTFVLLLHFNLMSGV